MRGRRGLGHRDSYVPSAFLGRVDVHANVHAHVYVNVYVNVGVDESIVMYD